MSNARPGLRAWSSLGEDERARLLADYQPVVDETAATCDFQIKLSRMQAWLATRGISITEDEIRGRRQG